jgi:hypothetical protein
MAMSDMASRSVFSAPVRFLYAWTYCEPRSDLLNRLAERATIAGSRDTAVWLGDEEFRFVLRGHGWRNYPFVLSGPDFEIALGAPAPFPRVVVTAHAPFVERLGDQAACEEVGRLLGQHLLAHLDGFYWFVQTFDPQELIPDEPPGDAA